MSYLAAADNFLDRFRRMREGAFRLELRDRYNAPPEYPRWEAFQAGDWPRLENLNRVERAAWMEVIGQAVTAGRYVNRVRVVSEPPTRYIQFELLLNAGNAEVGEDIRYLPRAQAALLDLPGVDFWLFDSATAVVLEFDDDDMLLTMDEVTDPALIAAFRQARDTAWRHAIPYPEYDRKWAHLGDRPPSP